MNKKVIIPLVVILVIIGIVLVIRTDEIDEEMNGEDVIDPEEVTFYIEAEGREFYIDGQENPNIVVNQGDEVVIEFTVTGGTHDFVIDEFGVATEVLSEGEIQTIDFVADQVGEFEYYCSVGTHRAEGMYGSLIVE